MKILKIYIKINLANNFIYLLKFFIKVFILFNKKYDRDFYLYIDYWSLDNFIKKILKIIILSQILLPIKYELLMRLVVLKMMINWLRNL